MNRVHVFDDLIHNHVHKAEDLLNRASEVLANRSHPNDFAAQISNLRVRLTELTKSYLPYHK